MLPLCRMPQTKPDSRQDSCSLVLPWLLEPKGAVRYFRIGVTSCLPGQRLHRIEAALATTLTDYALELRNPASKPSTE